MATQLNLLAGIGGYKPSSGRAPTPQDIVSDRYRGMMKAQMDAAINSLKEIIADIKNVSVDILYEALEPTLELAKSYCPVDTGVLRDSGYLEKQTYEGGARVILGFAKGGDPPYAILVHEMTNLRHLPPTRSKFLLAAIEEDSANIYGRIVRAFKLP